MANRHLALVPAVVDNLSTRLNNESSQSEITPFDYSQYPKTITAGIPPETWDYIKSEEEPMPYDELDRRLGRIEAKLDDAIKAAGQQEYINRTVDRNATILEGERGVLVRLRIIEEWKGWWDKMFWAVLAGVGTIFVDVGLRVWDHFK